MALALVKIDDCRSLLSLGVCFVMFCFFPEGQPSMFCQKSVTVGWQTCGSRQIYKSKVAPPLSVPKSGLPQSRCLNVHQMYLYPIYAVFDLNMIRKSSHLFLNLKFVIKPFLFLQFSSDLIYLVSQVLVRYYTGVFGVISVQLLFQSGW